MKIKLAIIATLLICHLSFAQKTNQYTNPILAGFYPDPSICKAGDAYYLVNSTFAYFPGLPIFKSYDLVHWKQIGNVIDRASQMDFDGAGVSRGLFAPAIRFHDGIFYLTCTLVSGKGNFVVTATNPAGPWSDPVWLPEVNGIDPSLFFEGDKAYIVYNSIPPENKSLYDGHRSIRINEFDFKQLKIISENRILVNGGTDLSQKPSWIEGPHIVKKDGKYILYAAQGGTGFNHSEVAFKSDQVGGPYIPYENNPILKQKLDNNNQFPITSTGHADLVETENGKWAAVFLGCRPYESDYYNTGRETFMAPVEWKDGWPNINPNFETVQYHYPFLLAKKDPLKAEQHTGNFEFNDEFNQKELQNGWIFLRAPKTNWYNLTEKKGDLIIQLQAATCAGKTNPPFIARRMQHINAEVSIAVNFNTNAENEKAGLLVFQNEEHFFFIAKSIQHNIPSVQLFKSNKSGNELIASQELTNLNDILELKMLTDGKTCNFYYATKNADWKLLADNVDGKFLSTKVAGGFVGTMIGPYATSNGIKSINKANFLRFHYKGNDGPLK